MGESNVGCYLLRVFPTGQTLNVFFLTESCGRSEYVYLRWKQEMSYRCAENMAQLSGARDGLSILQEYIKEKREDSPTKAVRGPEIAEQANQMTCLYCSLTLQVWQTGIRPDRFSEGK